MRPMTAAEQHEEAMGTLSTETRTLFCVAAEEFDNRTMKWRLELNYNHADDAHASKAIYVQNRVREGKIFRIVAVAPVIGYKVLDNQGLVLAA